MSRADLDLNAEWDDGSFDKDIPGWVENPVRLLHEGDEVVLERSDRRVRGRIGELRALSQRVDLHFEDGPRCFSLGRRRFVSPGELPLRATLGKTGPLLQLALALPEIVSATLRSVVPEAPEVSGASMLEGPAVVERGVARRERAWERGHREQVAALDLDEAGTFAFAVSLTRGPDPYVYLSLDREGALSCLLRMTADEQETAMRVLLDRLAPHLGEAALGER